MKPSKEVQEVFAVVAVVQSESFTFLLFFLRNYWYDLLEFDIQGKNRDAGTEHFLRSNRISRFVSMR